MLFLFFLTGLIQFVPVNISSRSLKYGTFPCPWYLTISWVSQSYPPWDLNVGLLKKCQSSCDPASTVRVSLVYCSLAWIATTSLKEPQSHPSAVIQWAEDQGQRFQSKTKREKKETERG